MTNKKFKLAAMSMALTACVAAQPMIANAAETGDVQEPVSNTNESSTSPQSAPADENDSVQSGEDGGAGASAEEKKEDGVNQEADKTEEAFGEDVDINYDPATKTEDPDTGSSTIKGDVVKKDEDKGESEDKSESEGESEEKNESEGDGETGEKKDEESEKIGDATKTETPDPDGTVTEDPVPKPGGESKTESKPGVDEDGNTTITNTTTTGGTQTSTSTGSGHAEADTKEETETKKEDIDLKDELGGAEIDWDVKRDADVGDTGYKVASVETIEDGKQTLTLKKVDTVSGEMSAEDIAKLVDAETPTVNEDGSYTLKRTETVTGEDGKTITRTTYITVNGSKVTTTTTTLLTVTREKENHKDTETVNNNFKLPDIIVTDKENSENKQTIASNKLSEMLSEKYLDPEDGRYYYEEEDGDTRKEYIITVDKESAGKLTNDEIVAKLNSENFQLGDDGEIYYVANGQKAKLSVDQANVLREKLSISVEMRVTSKSETRTDGKDEEAKETAQINALKDALTKAAQKAGIATGSDEFLNELNSQITSSSLSGGSFTFTQASNAGSKTFTFNFNATTVGTEPKITDATDPTVPGYNKDEITDVKDNTYTGSATVTNGTVTWDTSESYKYLEKDSFTDGIRKDFDFTKAPEGATNMQSKDGYVTYYELDGKIYEFTFTKSTTQGDKTGSFVTASWTVTTPANKKDSEDIPDSRPAQDFELSDPNWASSKNADDTYNFTYEGGSASNLSYKGKDDQGNDVYEGTAADGTVTTITVKSTSVDDDALIEAKLREQYGSTVVLDKESKTYTYKDGETTYKGRYSTVQKSIDVVKKSPYEVAGTGYSKKEAQQDFLNNIKKALGELKDGEELVFNGEYTISSETKWEDIVSYVQTVVNYDALTDADLIEMLKKQKADAVEKDQYYSGTTAGTWYEKPDGTRVDSWYVEKFSDGKYYYREGWGYNARWIEVKKVTTKNDYIGHLDLATDSELTLAEKNEDGSVKKDDCVLIEKKLEWNLDAEKLVKGEGNTTVGLIDRITYDDENDDDPTTGHYEFARKTWDSGRDDNTINKAPTESAFYKLTGTVAYGQVGETYTSKWVDGKRGQNGHYDYDSAKTKAQAALDAYKAEYVKNDGNPDDLKNAQVVEICSDQGINGKRSYKIYLYTSSLTAYGYMSDASNTCGNHHDNAQHPGSYVGGYDLTIGDLTQINKEEIVAQGRNVFNYSATPTKISRLLDQVNQTLTATPDTKRTTEVIPAKQDKGSYTSGTYTVNHSDSLAGAEGSGTGSHKSFAEWLVGFFSGEKKDLSRDTGSFSYSYTTVSDLEAASKTQTVEKHAEADYTYKTIEVKDVDIVDTEVIVITPDDDPIPPTRPELPPVQEETPVTPEASVLPPVQDATPDAPVLPTNVILPAVQDAHALPKTGVNWLAAIGLALSGFCLMSGGAWASLTGKNAKH